jgi:hypothetical protein
MDDDTKTLHCNNDACEFKSARYLYFKGANYMCPECGTKLEAERPKREAHARGPRRFDTF